MKNIFKINFENLEPVVELPVNDFLEEQEDLESVNFIVSNDELISEEVQEYDELASDIELVENLNNTLENQLENNQANDASLEMYHVAMEQVFRKYNIPYKNNVVSTEEGRLHVTEAEDKNKIEMLPVCHPSDIKNYVYKLHDALDQMSKLEKKINSVDFAGLMERRKEHEAIMDELHEKLVKDGHGEISNRAANSFRKHNKVLMVYFSNLGTVLKYNSKYINSLVDYFDEVNRVFKRVSPYVGTTK